MSGRHLLQIYCLVVIVLLLVDFHVGGASDVNTCEHALLLLVTFCCYFLAVTASVNLA